MMRQALALIAILALGCGTTQHATIPEQVLVDGFPAQPYRFQKRPGKDSRCDSQRGPPDVIVRGGGCWEWVVPTPEECVQARKQGAATVLYEGRCYYPMLNTIPQREPTSSLYRPIPEEP